jgi:hypothetical protein
VATTLKLRTSARASKILNIFFIILSFHELSIALSPLDQGHRSLSMAQSSLP